MRTSVGTWKWGCGVDITLMALPNISLVSAAPGTRYYRCTRCHSVHVSRSVTVVLTGVDDPNDALAYV